MPRARSDEVARRLIAVLGKLKPGARVPLASLAEQLGVTPAEIGADILTLSLCGVAPYDPFALVPVMIDGDVVEVFGEIPALKGPVRLSAGEAGALSAALQAAGFAAEDPLAQRVLAASATPFDAVGLEHVVRTVIDAHDASVYECLARALDEKLVVRIEYVNAGEVEPSTREVEPVALFAERGAWYLTGWCRTANDWRTFRIDRFVSAELTDERAERAAPDEPVFGRAFDPRGLPTARLRFLRDADFSARDWPGARVVAMEDGAAVVDVPYNGTAWIARTVAARLGAVEVVEPREVRSAVVRLARDWRLACS